MHGTLPPTIQGYGAVRSFSGAFCGRGVVNGQSQTSRPTRRGMAKTLPNIRAAIEACGLSSGGTVSFHHHLRNGDGVLNSVMDEIARLGLRDMTVAASPSSPFPPHLW